MDYDAWLLAPLNGTSRPTYSQCDDGFDNDDEDWWEPQDDDSEYWKRIMRG